MIAIPGRLFAREQVLVGATMLLLAVSLQAQGGPIVRGSVRW